MKLRLIAMGITMSIGFGCAPSDDPISTQAPQPREIIDLGILITEDIPESLWGKRFLDEMGFDRNNSFEVIDWEFADGAVSGSNAYLTLFNHGGPHVDAPNHVGLGAGLDSYDIQAFAGPLRVVDVSQYEPGRTVPIAAFEGQGHRPKPGRHEFASGSSDPDSPFVFVARHPRLRVTGQR